MGCFLVLTEKDLDRISTGLRVGISVVEYRSGEVIIEVNPVGIHSAREMAKLIRSQAQSAQVTQGSTQESKWAVATPERFAHIVTILSEICPPAVASYFENVQSQFKDTMIRAGKKEAELAAAKILVQTGHLDGGQEYTITRSTGVDITGKNVAGTPVFVEVKLSNIDKNFGSRMQKGAYEDNVHPEGYVQMTNGWLERVLDDFDPSKAHILGVHINLMSDKVTIYRRIDPDAKNWQVLYTRPLSDFDL